MMESVSESLEQRNTGEEVQRECDPCKERDETVTGFKFCLDCQEVYCKKCTDSHKMFKMSTHHWLIDTRHISSMVSRASFFTSFTICPNHPHREVEFYCKDHDAVFCIDCFNSTHTFCNTQVVSNHANDASKLREEAEELMAQMENAIDQLQLLITMTEGIKKDLRKNLKEGQREQMQDRIYEGISRLSEIKEQNEAKVILLDTISRHGSERQQFISTHLVKTQLKELGRTISEEDQSLRNIKVELKLADDLHVKINETESDPNHLGAVTNYLRDSNLVLVEEHAVRPNVEDLPMFYGVSMNKDGRVILCDCSFLTRRGYLCLYNPVNRTMLELKMNIPRSATQIDDTLIAVSVPGDKTISIVTVGNDLRVEKTFKTQNMPGSIVALSNGQLAVAWIDTPAFGLIDISGTKLVPKSYFDHDKHGRKFKTFSYLAVDEKRYHVIQPCYVDEAVYCFDITGEPVFRYTNPELRYPTSLRGVALDNCGNIYVCDGIKNSIHKLSPAGELISIFTEGVPSGSWSICSDNTGTGFWVTQMSSQDKIVYFRLEQNTET